MVAKMREISFPRECARSLNYTLGAPRSFRVSADGRRVFFLRSPSGFERRLDLWQIDFTAAGPTGPEESLVISAGDLRDAGSKNIVDPAAELSRRERVREAASGITSYSIDETGEHVAFSLGGDIYVHYLLEARTLIASLGTASDVKLSPDGTRIAFVSDRELYIAGLGDEQLLAPVRISPPATKSISWGVPDFIAAEEIRRQDGYWWAPDSQSVVFVRVDESRVVEWHISNPVNPSIPSRPVRYPQAGTPNAELSVFWWRGTSELAEVKWNSNDFPYIIAVKWNKNEPTLVVQDRRQKSLVVLCIDPGSFETFCVYEETDPLWVELIEGVPFWDSRSALVDAPDAETRRLRVSNLFISPESLEIRRVIGQSASGAYVYLASPQGDARETHVWVSDRGEHFPLSRSEGVFNAELGGDTVVVYGTRLSNRPHTAEIVRLKDGANVRLPIRNVSAEISNRPQPQFRRSKIRKLDYAVLYPNKYRFDRPLPVLMDPYGGPWFQRCVKSSLSYTVSQWFADQGFAVIVADGRGTPGRGRTWEKAVAGDLITKILEDQLAALDDALAAGAPLDRNKVAIRGWSFGGSLAALAVLLCPERFHAAVAGAPVSDWRFYDTHYAERYLGDPGTNKDNFDRCSAVFFASRLQRPLLLIHGLNDDNVVFAHTLRLSEALFEAGKEHYVLPLTQITHMAASENAAEHILNLQLKFIRRSLGLKKSLEPSGKGEEIPLPDRAGSRG
jgi:dipeptidyl-peptidase-4